MTEMSIPKNFKNLKNPAGTELERTRKTGKPGIWRTTELQLFGRKLDTKKKPMEKWSKIVEMTLDMGIPT